VAADGIYRNNLISQSKSWLDLGWRRNSEENQKIIQKLSYIRDEKRILIKSHNQSKSLLHRGWRGNIDENKYINQKVVYIFVEG
jgi:hypothetical protein